MPNLVLAEELTSPSPTPAASAEPSESPDPSPTPTPTTMELESGEAVAEAESETEVNTTSVNSEVETTTATVGEGDGDLVPFELSEEDAPSAGSGQAPSSAPSTGGQGGQALSEAIEEISEATPPVGLQVVVSNEATVAGSTSATAETGNNTQNNQSGGEAQMETGTAVAVASSINLVNTTLVNSELEVGIIKILPGWEGDVIIDPLESNMQWGYGLGKISIDGNGNVVIETIAEANTGNNSQVGMGETTMTTGGAVSQARSNVIVGMTVINADVIKLLVDNLWLWNGQILNFEYPGSVQEASELNETQGRTGGCTGECGELDLTVHNTADVDITTEASANTGNNTQISSGSATMQTGNAIASATSTTLVNTTLINSRMTLLHFLLFGEWSGNLIFAYPDLVTSVSAPESVEEGEEIEYTIGITNVGYKKAMGVSYDYLITNDSHEVGSGQEQTAQLAPGETIEQKVRFGTQGRGGHTVTLTATAQGENTEVSTSNNTAKFSTLVVSKETPVEEQKEPFSSEVPILSLSGGNNGENGVYPGDGLRYDFRAVNHGPIKAYKVVFVQEFYTLDGTILSTGGGPVGEIELNHARGVSFVMSPGKILKPGEYYTLSYLVGANEYGVETRSNVVKNLVKLLGNTGGLVGQVVAAEPPPAGEGEVLGRATPTGTASCQDCLSLPWYLGVAIGSLAYYLVNRRQEDGWKVFKWGLVLPLSGYAGLLYTMGDCRTGIQIVESASEWCRLFLPLSYGVYAGVGGLARLFQRGVIPTPFGLATTRSRS